MKTILSTVPEDNDSFTEKHISHKEMIMLHFIIEFH